MHQQSKTILLGSKSPRRKELLQALHIDFKVVSINCDENFSESLPLAEVAEFLANKKSKAYEFPLSENEILITADTVVIVENEILNKPENESHAELMLQKLSGKKHQVISGICLRSASKKQSFSVETQVYFKHLSTEEIDFYINKYRPFDKAGAYGIQEWLGYMAVEKIEGSYSNVVGLPTSQIFKALAEFY